MKVLTLKNEYDKVKCIEFATNGLARLQFMKLKSKNEHLIDIVIDIKDIKEIKQ